MLTEHSSVLDKDEHGFDALDFFILNADKFENRQQWIGLFEGVDWQFRDSHKYYLEKSKSILSLEEYSVLLKIITNSE